MVEFNGVNIKIGKSMHYMQHQIISASNNFCINFNYKKGVNVTCTNSPPPFQVFPQALM
jgi:hypothetical protein